MQIWIAKIDLHCDMEKAKITCLYNAPSMHTVENIRFLFESKAPRIHKPAPGCCPTEIQGKHPEFLHAQFFGLVCLGGIQNAFCNDVLLEHYGFIVRFALAPSTGQKGVCEVLCFCGVFKEQGQGRVAKPAVFTRVLRSLLRQQSFQFEFQNSFSCKFGSQRI